MPIGARPIGASLKKSASEPILPIKARVVAKEPKALPAEEAESWADGWSGADEAQGWGEQAVEEAADGGLAETPLAAEDLEEEPSFAGEDLHGSLDEAALEAELTLAEESMLAAEEDFLLDEAEVAAGAEDDEAWAAAQEEAEAGPVAEAEAWAEDDEAWAEAGAEGDAQAWADAEVEGEAGAEADALADEDEERFADEVGMELDSLGGDLGEEEGAGDGAEEAVDNSTCDAVESSLKISRALSQSDVLDSKGEPAAKRQKVEVLPVGARPAGSLWMKRWRLTEEDAAVKFVLRTATPQLLEELRRTPWAPCPTYKKSVSEQVAEKLSQLKEAKCPAAGDVNAVTAFCHRRNLPALTCSTLSKLDYRKLSFALSHFDGNSVDELVQSAPSDTDLPVPDRNGAFVMRRSACLELIDPWCDALILGDANLSFSLVLAEHRRSLHHSGQIVATTFEQLDTLRERYPEIDETIEHLRQLNTEVVHGVDCTRLAVDERFKGMPERFGAVYYNFPHAGVVTGYYDGHPFVRWRHANLMHLFFRALRCVAREGAIVKVASNSRATGVRFSDIICGGAASEFEHTETFPFLDWSLSRYRRSYGDRRDVTKRPEDGQVYNAQRSNSDMVYTFAYRPTGAALPPPEVCYPPTRDELLLSKEGRLPPAGESRKRRVEELYELFLSYVKGVHIG